MQRKAGGATLLLVLLLPGCGRPARLSGPAPAGALNCAIAHATAFGYEAMEGGADRGFVRLAQRVETGPPGAGRSQPRPDLADVVLDRQRGGAVQNEILVEVANGRLELMMLALDDAGVELRPGRTVEDHARTILTLCSADPPALPPVVNE